MEVQGHNIVLHERETILIRGKFSVIPATLSRFAPGCFDSQIGKSIPFKIEDRLVGEAKIVAVDIIASGTIAEMTFETDIEEVKALLQNTQYKGVGPEIFQ